MWVMYGYLVQVEIFSRYCKSMGSRAELKYWREQIGQSNPKRLKIKENVHIFTYKIDTRSLSVH